mmetsp:Transcript_14117/g.25081  ORF Transcript_14117/g.25081 Transcript_14117/m.25081 type:complete len:658 (-) Transcript_14117:42-2015(-)
MCASTPCGEWKSPIHAQQIFGQPVVFKNVIVDMLDKRQREGTVFWVESRPAEGGRSVVCSIDKDRCRSDWTVEAHSCSTRLHEYGGLACCVSDGVVYYSNVRDGRLYKQLSPDAQPVAISPENAHFRFADFVVDSTRQIIYTVFEDHTNVGGAAQYPTNCIACVDIATGKIEALASGSDFYVSPRLSPDGSMLAWVEWSFPNMPWTATTLWKANLTPSGRNFVQDSLRKVAGNGEECVGFPRWSHNNGLYYIADSEKWANIFTDGCSKSIFPKAVDFANVNNTQPTFNMFGFENGRLVGFYKQSGRSRLVCISLSDFSVVEVQSNFDEFKDLSCLPDGSLVCIASNWNTSPSIVKIDIASGSTEVLAANRGIEFTGYMSKPEFIQFPTSESDTAYGYYYPPCNKDTCVPKGELPPLIVRAHGGPVGYTSPSLTMRIQYFTSRGFAFLDVDYRGSVGYGREYRDRLYKNYGIFDADDCANGALYLTKLGKVDKERIVIEGPSAGGFTTLRAVTSNPLFKAGASLYGISDLSLLNEQTHKFEAHYLSLLISEDDNSDSFKERSPLHSLDKICRPVVLFQGTEDKAVPPNQSRLLFDKVRKMGVPVALEMFQGEGHGFVKQETLVKCVEGELYFFRRILGMRVTEELFEVDIENIETFFL